MRSMIPWKKVLRSLGRGYSRKLSQGGKISGVDCLEAEVGEIMDGKRQFKKVGIQTI